MKPLIAAACATVTLGVLLSYQVAWSHAVHNIDTENTPMATPLPTTPSDPAASVPEAITSSPTPTEVPLATDGPVVPAAQAPATPQATPVPNPNPEATPIPTQAPQIEYATPGQSGIYP